jgi:hypothetical protein
MVIEFEYLRSIAKEAAREAAIPPGMVLWWSDVARE